MQGDNSLELGSYSISRRDSKKRMKNDDDDASKLQRILNIKVKSNEINLGSEILSLERLVISVIETKTERTLSGLYSSSFTPLKNYLKLVCKKVIQESNHSSYSNDQLTLFSSSNSRIGNSKIYAARLVMGYSVADYDILSKSLLKEVRNLNLTRYIVHIKPSSSTSSSSSSSYSSKRNTIRSLIRTALSQLTNQTFPSSNSGIHALTSWYESEQKDKAISEREPIIFFLQAIELFNDADIRLIITTFASLVPKLPIILILGMGTSPDTLISAIPADAGTMLSLQTFVMTSAIESFQLFADEFFVQDSPFKLTYETFRWLANYCITTTYSMSNLLYILSGARAQHYHIVENPCSILAQPSEQVAKAYGLSNTKSTSPEKVQSLLQLVEEFSKRNEAGKEDERDEVDEEDEEEDLLGHLLLACPSITKELENWSVEDRKPFLTNPSSGFKTISEWISSIHEYHNFLPFLFDLVKALQDLLGSPYCSDRIPIDTYLHFLQANYCDSKEYLELMKLLKDKPPAFILEVWKSVYNLTYSYSDSTSDQFPASVGFSKKNSEKIHEFLGKLETHIPQGLNRSRPKLTESELLWIQEPLWKDISEMISSHLVHYTTFPCHELFYIEKGDLASNFLPRYKNTIEKAFMKPEVYLDEEPITDLQTQNVLASVVQDWDATPDTSILYQSIIEEPRDLINLADVYPSFFEFWKSRDIKNPSIEVEENENSEDEDDEKVGSKRTRRTRRSKRVLSNSNSRKKKSKIQGIRNEPQVRFQQARRELEFHGCIKQMKKHGYALRSRSHGL